MFPYEAGSGGESTVDRRGWTVYFRVPVQLLIGVGSYGTQLPTGVGWTLWICTQLSLRCYLSGGQYVTKSKRMELLGYFWGHVYGDLD